MNEISAPVTGTAVAALDLFIEAVDSVAPDDWDRPSNLDDWSVRQLVGHATGSAAKVVTLVEGGQLWGRSEPADWLSDNPVARLGELAVRLRKVAPDADLTAMRDSPAGRVPLEKALAFPVSDLALHSWDLHRSCGRQIELPDGLLEFCQALVDSVDEAQLRRPGGFGPACPAPADATPTARLMAYLGRSVEPAS